MNNPPVKEIEKSENKLQLSNTGAELQNKKNTNENTKMDLELPSTGIVRNRRERPQQVEKNPWENVDISDEFDVFTRNSKQGKINTQNEQLKPLNSVPAEDVNIFNDNPKKMNTIWNTNNATTIKEELTLEKSPPKQDELELPKSNIPKKDNQVSNNNIAEKSFNEEVMKGAQTRNRIARLRKGGDTQNFEEGLNLNGSINTVTNPQNTTKKSESIVDPFARFDDISGIDFAAKAKDLFGTKNDNKPFGIDTQKDSKNDTGSLYEKGFSTNNDTIFPFGNKPLEAKNDLGSLLDDQFGNKTEDTTVNARRMRMYQKDKSSKQNDAKERVS